MDSGGEEVYKHLMIHQPLTYHLDMTSTQTTFMWGVELCLPSKVWKQFLSSCSKLVFERIVI